eukprot:CAMPEP_0169154264 /NCGR_PEP_ID=MMETSP1015-20121227/52603_1 /TAXON_ID=342587 /ORGANISM="Karlodinium micrum, Strain CCMP2283" /LENGTH=365 /DNA_ID=CAMNT_0009224411 /DNA_START=1 /DNA_END=1095 /DNA_ORIENTATION=-
MAPDVVSVMCKDNRRLRHTAVHAAVRGGSDNHLKVIKLLIGAGAKLDVTQGEEFHCPGHKHPLKQHVFESGHQCNVCGKKVESSSKMYSCWVCRFFKCEACDAKDRLTAVGPVRSAISLNHAQILKYFVENNHLFPNWERQEVWEKKLESLFRSPNTVTICAVAEGLRSATDEQVRRLPPKYLIKILDTPGFAPVHIMEAVFRKSRLEYLEEDDEGDSRRLVMDTAHVRPGEVNVIEARDDFTKQLLRKRAKQDEPERLKYKIDILEGRMAQWYDYFDREMGSRSQVDVYYCVLPNIHRNIDVLIALCNTPNADVFEVDGVEAFTEFLWQSVRSYQIVVTLLNSIVLLAFMIFTITLNHSDDGVA